VLWDGALPGFGLRVFPSGAKSFVVFYRAGTRQRLMTVGRYGLYTLQQARLMARKLLTRVADGEDPLGERRKDRREVTMNQLWERYLEEYARPRKKLRTIRDELGVWGRYLARGFGPRPLSQVTRQDVAGLHNRLRATPYGANDAVKLLRQLYNVAAEWELVAPDENPTRFIKLFKEKPRERYLSSDELHRLGRALRELEEEGMDPFAIEAVRLLLLTGARAAEILKLSWGEVELEDCLLRLRDSKTGPKNLELPVPAAQALHRLQALRLVGSPYVFPGRDPSKPRNDYIKRPWKKICARAEIKDCRLHDLRHSYASTGAGGGFSLQMIGELLGHRQTSTTERYSHLSRDPKKGVAESIAATLAAALGEGSNSSDVV